MHFFMKIVQFSPEESLNSLTHLYTVKDQIRFGYLKHQKQGPVHCFYTLEGIMNVTNLITYMEFICPFKYALGYVLFISTYIRINVEADNGP